MKKELAFIHPGEILSEDFLKPMNMTAYRLAKETHLDPKRISEIIRGKRAVSADTALRFSKFYCHWFKCCCHSYCSAQNW